MNASVVERLALACGFDLAGVTPALPSADAGRYLEWVATGKAGRMGYLADHRARIRADPRRLLPSAKSIVCVAKSYHRNAPGGSIARYARSQDYHAVMRDGLEQLAARMRQEFGPFDYRVCVDTAPLLERSYARDAGLGWIGRNTCLIDQEYGSYTFLGELLVSLDAPEPAAPAPFRCGTCTRCIDACPTAAIGETLDATRCISYFTIEWKGSLTSEAREAAAEHVFGCDVCQEVCPWNRKAKPSADPAFAPVIGGAPELDRLARLTAEEFRAEFRDTPVWRAKYSGLLRNVAIAMGNSGERKFEPALRELAASPDPVIAEHAEWALERLASR